RGSLVPRGDRWRRALVHAREKPTLRPRLYRCVVGKGAAPGRAVGREEGSSHEQTNEGPRRPRGGRARHRGVEGARRGAQGGGGRTEGRPRRRQACPGSGPEGIGERLPGGPQGGGGRRRARAQARPRGGREGSRGGAP